MQEKKEKARVDRELKEAVGKLQRINKKQRTAEAAATAILTAKSYTAAMLGQGKKNGGAQQYQKARFEVLDRVRKVGELSPEQTGQWTYFKQCWDERMAETNGENWGQL